MNTTAIRVQRFAFDIIYYVLWIIEVLLLLSFVLKLLGANPSNQLVAFLHATSVALMGPVSNIFPSVFIEGNMVLDISLLAAMVMYALLAYVLISFLKLINRNTPPTIIS